MITDDQFETFNRACFNNELTDIQVARLQDTLNFLHESKKDKATRDIKTALYVQGKRIAWITDKCSPAYLIGREVEILEIRTSRVLVKLVKPLLERRFSGRFTIPMDMIVLERPFYVR